MVQTSPNQRASRQNIHLERGREKGRKKNHVQYQRRKAFLTLMNCCMMLLEPDLSQKGMIREPLWSCLSKGGEITLELFKSDCAGRKQSVVILAIAMITHVAIDPDNHDFRRIVGISSDVEEASSNRRSFAETPVRAKVPKVPYQRSPVSHLFNQVRCQLRGRCLAQSVVQLDAYWLSYSRFTCCREPSVGNLRRIKYGT